MLYRVRKPEPRGVLAAGLCLLLAAGAGGRAAALEPDAAEPTGEQIYARVLANRFESFTQVSRLSSGDRSGRIQETRLRMQWKDFRDAAGVAVRGVISKLLIKYTHPFDLRHSGYLVIQNKGRLNDQFVYLPARRQTVRVNLRGEAVFGSDFSFEDVIPRDLEDATYRRLADAVHAGQPVYVVEARPTELFDSEYSKFVFYVDRGKWVPLRTRYWNHAGVEVKELLTDAADVERYGEVFVPMRLTMRNLQLDTFSTLEVVRLEPDAELSDRLFDLRRLESH